MGLDNGGGVKHGYGAERTIVTVGNRLQRWYIEGWRHGDGSERNSVDIRQSSRGWVGSGDWAEEHGNRDVETGEGR